MHSVEIWLRYEFFKMTPTTSVRNEYRQQMRIQILILGLKGVKVAGYSACSSPKVYLKKKKTCFNGELSCQVE